MVCPQWWSTGDGNGCLSHQTVMRVCWTQCCAFVFARDVIVWNVGGWEVKFGHFGSAEPLQLLYTGSGREGHYIPVVPKALAQLYLLPLQVQEIPQVGWSCYVVLPNGCCW